MFVIFVVVTAVAAILFATCGIRQARRQAIPPTMAELQDRLGYSLREVRREGRPVPRVYLAELPPDLPAVADPGKRKRAFLAVLLPIVLAVNEEISAERQRLLRLKEKQRMGQKWSSRDKKWLAGLADRYGLAKIDLELLARRVDVIPPSLALAQASIESGWGTSRFAQDGNALFGQRLWQPRGMVPAQRQKGERHRVRAFSQLTEAVRAYTGNLNSHRNYIGLRGLRAAIRARGETPSGIDLAPTLTTYSERGNAYIADILSVINGNGLAAFDRAKLDLGGTFGGC